VLFSCLRRVLADSRLYVNISDTRFVSFDKSNICTKIDSHAQTFVRSQKPQLKFITADDTAISNNLFRSEFTVNKNHVKIFPEFVNNFPDLSPIFRCKYVFRIPFLN